MNAFLRVKSGTGERSVRLRTQPLTIGRHESNGLVIDDSMASRFHCVIEREVGGFLLRDLQSRNGTLLNGQRVMNSALKAGDVIAIGAVEMKVVIRPGVGTPGAAGAGAGGRPGVGAAGARGGKANAVEAVDDDMEVIEELEVMDEVGGSSVPGAPPVNSPFRALRKAADAMPDHSFDVDTINLISMRGKPLHEGQVATAGEAIMMLRLILLVCFRSHATDIHLEPRADDFLLRIRMDGNLIDMCAFSRELGVKLTAAIKVLCELDTTQRSIVQEGHYALTIPGASKMGGEREAHGRRVDYRVSFVPSLHGQKMVIRVFDTANGPQMLQDLQLPGNIMEEVNEELTRDAGLILVCGPTGSGKTTTLYSLLRSCGSSFRNIITIEDPVEVQIEGTTQLPVDEANGKSFAALLRSVLRQDPDVIMVGEIRDSETAKIALQAAMTGHLVLSTIHTRDTPGTIFRLLDLGIEGYVVAQGLHLVLAQRLVRSLCTTCRRAIAISDEDRKRMGRAADGVSKIYAPVGCPKCLGTGYYSRRAFFEFLSTNDKLREQMMKSPSLTEIQNILGPNFMKLSDHGYQLVAQGLTSIDEVERAVGK